jgi:hypothetical protein
LCWALPNSMSPIVETLTFRKITLPITTKDCIIQIDYFGSVPAIGSVNHLEDIWRSILRP